MGIGSQRPALKRIEKLRVGVERVFLVTGEAEAAQGVVVAGQAAGSRQAGVEGTVSSHGFKVGVVATLPGKAHGIEVAAGSGGSLEAATGHVNVAVKDAHPVVDGRVGDKHSPSTTVNVCAELCFARRPRCRHYLSPS